MNQYQNYFEFDTLSKTINLKKFLTDLAELSVSEKNKIIMFHNEASTEKIYGIKLHYYLQQLKSQGKISKQTVDKIYVLSIDWP